jgi:hypothetical protein
MSDENENNMGADDPEALAEAKKILGDRQWPVTIPLSVPVQAGKETIEELTFQRGNLGVLKGIPIDRAPTMDELMVIASKLCERPIKVIEKLDPDDADEVIAIALGFIGRCRGAGKKLSAR